VLYRKKLGTVASANRFLDFWGPEESRRGSGSCSDAVSGGDEVRRTRWVGGDGVRWEDEMGWNADNGRKEKEGTG
jgi:hypothetical protein